MKNQKKTSRSQPSRPKSPTKKSKAKSSTSPLKDPRGGLTAAGREHFRKTQGAHLKPGVRGKADTPEKMKRKGSFLRRHYANLRGPLLDAKGRPTRLSLQAAAWGEQAPKTKAAAKKLANRGKTLLKNYAKTKSKKTGSKTSTKNT